MNFNCNVLFQVSTTFGFRELVVDSNRPKDAAISSITTNQSRVNNYPTIVSDSFNTIPRSNDTADVNNLAIRRQFHLRNERRDDLIEGIERRKRDIRNDILENELQIVSNAYGLEITSQMKSAVNTIVSQSDGLDGLRNLLTFSFNNLATTGLNDVPNFQC